MKAGHLIETIFMKGHSLYHKSTSRNGGFRGRNTLMSFPSAMLPLARACHWLKAHQKSVDKGASWFDSQRSSC